MRIKQFNFFNRSTYAAFFLASLVMSGGGVGLIAAIFNGPIEQQVEVVQMEEVVIIG